MENTLKRRAAALEHSSGFLTASNIGTHDKNLRTFFAQAVEQSLRIVVGFAASGQNDPLRAALHQPLSEKLAETTHAACDEIGCVAAQRSIHRLIGIDGQNDLADV